MEIMYYWKPPLQTVQSTNMGTSGQTTEGQNCLVSNKLASEIASKSAQYEAGILKTRLIASAR